MPAPGFNSIVVRGPLSLGLSLALAAAGPAAAAPAPAAAPWPVGLYNPKPLPDDLILPLPCGGALALRPVATPADSRRTRLIGPFAGPTGDAQRHLLIGKYEVSALQYQTVMAQGSGQACPPVAAAPAGSQVDPRLAAQVGVSRIDAVNFAAQLSRWLQANAGHIPPCAAGAKPCLPRVDGKPAFVRLPLDLEWEYAARGGALVPDDTFALPRYPMPEGLDRHAWYNRNADGEIAPIGRRLPNPLGLHDLYGNAWELMNDPYSSPQFPGQVGGDVLMGGGIHSADEELRADARVEVQPYDAAGDVKTADTGFRVVLAAPVVTSAARVPAAPRPPAPDQDRPAAATAPASAPVPPRAASVDGHLRIEVDAAAMVYVDGEVKGAVKAGLPLDLTGLAHGSHRIKAQSSYAQAQTTVQLTDPAPVEVHIHLEQTPDRAESLLGLTPDERRRVREQLSQLGYPCDPASDRFDRGFRVVLAEFQRHAGLAVTGHLTPETRAQLERRVAERQRALKAAERAPAPPPHPGGHYLQPADPAPDGRWMDPAAP